MPKISLIASSVRLWLWEEFLESFRSNQIDYEVVFAGDLDQFQTRYYLKKYPELRYIHTGRIKPAQCYQVAYKYAQGETILWICDDAEGEPRILNDVYDYWKSFNDNKAIISMRTNENGTLNNLDDHRFFGFNKNSPLMAPIALLSKSYIDDLGGFDRRIIAGQWENDFILRAYADGATLHKYEDKAIKIDHVIKHKTAQGTNPFWKPYEEDRRMLENIWCKGGYQDPEKPHIAMEKGTMKMLGFYYPIKNVEVLKKPNLPFEPYTDDDLLTKSQGPKGEWE